MRSWILFVGPVWRNGVDMLRLDGVGPGIAASSSAGFKAVCFSYFANPLRSVYRVAVGFPISCTEEPDRGSCREAQMYQSIRTV